MLQNDLNFEDAVEYHYGQFPPENLDYAQLVGPLADASDAIARYDQMLKNMHNSEILLAPLRNQEAVISSRMEGTISTMDEILEYEADLDDEDKSSRYFRTEVVETFLYQRAMRSAQRYLEEGRPINNWLIRAMHAELLSFGRGAKKAPGKFKCEQNYLADKAQKKVRFIPIRHEQLDGGLQKLFDYIDNSKHQILIKTAVSHIEFEALHPFQDGNGRIGRMLITLLLWKSEIISAPHFYVSGYFEEQKDAYIEALRAVSATNDWTPWCVFFLNAIKHQAVRNLEIAESIHALYEEMKEEFRKHLKSSWQMQALDFIFTNPVFRNNKFTSKSGIPKQTAQRFARTLVEKGLLLTVREASGRRPALYSFEPLMNLVRV